MDVNTSVVKKKQERNSMSGEGEWMEKTSRYGRRREIRWTPTRTKGQDTRASPNSLDTHLVRKWQGCRDPF